MLVSVLRANERLLARGAAVFILAGMAAGCSSQVTRFNSVDDVFTASTDNQRQIIKGGEDQPYPGDQQVAAAPIDGTHTESVSRTSLEPVSSQPLPAPVAEPVAAAAPVPQPAPKKTEPAVPFKKASPVDETATGSVEKKKDKQVASADASDPHGWSKAGGTQVTVKDGETVYNLSRRFGVPADVILQVNGLSKEGGLKAGQKVVIPTYVYSSKAPVSAPDSNPKVADAKSSTGNKSDINPAKVPLPSSAPKDKVAVLPQSPKLKEGEAAQSTEAASSDAKTTKTAKAGTYTVQSGDTLSRIAKTQGVSVSALKSANGLQDGLLQIGQTLKIPSGDGAVVAKADAKIDQTVTGTTGPAKKDGEKLAAYTPPKKSDSQVINEAEAEPETAPDATGIGRMRWPVRGRVVAGFGKGGGKASDGIDIAVPEGTPVKAAENGVVIYAGDGLKEFGNTVLVRHEDGLVTVYGNASELKVQRGQKVKRGEEIALSGMTGNADTPKLHFEVRKNSAPVDPATFLE
jgi:murein DD-endopeptidase MepM/ murein hydrolase activator NlpD